MSQSMPKDSPFTKYITMVRDSGLADDNMENKRVSTMNCIHIRLLQMVKFFEDMEAYGFRSEEERKVLLAFKPALLDASKKVDRLEREYHQRNALKRAFTCKNMSAFQNDVCELLLSIKLPANAFFEYVTDPDSKPPRTLDFAIPDKRIGIAIGDKDKSYDALAVSYGWTILRFSEQEFVNDPDWVRKTIRQAVVR
jgi:hypothetical protein